MKIKIKKITAKPFQSRQNFDQKEIEALAADIKANGLINPVTLRGEYGKYELIAGERRLRAHQLLGYDEIEANIVQATDAQAALIAAAENIQRENFTPLEEANAIDKALSTSSIDDVAAAFGRPVGYITRRHRLCALPDEWKKAVESGFAKKWTIAVLIEIARAPEHIQTQIMENYHERDFDTPTVEDIRHDIFDDGRLIKSAQFDTSECLRKCQSSTCATPSLFDDVVTAKKGDRCLDKNCWIDKKNAALKEKIEKFKTENSKGITIDHYSAPDELKKNAVNEWDCTKAKKTDKGAVPALSLETGKIEYVKLNKSAQEKAAKVDADGKMTMKEKRARLEKRRVIRYLEKIIAAIEELVKEKFDFPYSTTVPLVAIFGAESIPDEKSYKAPLDCKFDDNICQAGLFKCLAPKIIAQLHQETGYTSPEKKHGDIFKDWLGIACEKLYAEAVEEIPEPKSWAKEGAEKKTWIKTEIKDRVCRVCGCTETNPCLDDETGGPCSWVEADLCSACADRKKIKQSLGRSGSSTGARYLLDGDEIFVSSGLGGEQFGTFRVSDGGSGIKRIVAKSMPMVFNQEEAQENLNNFASSKNLPVVE
jgi:ParB/RepB/Spo0J family partition protein